MNVSKIQNYPQTNFTARFRIDNRDKVVPQRLINEYAKKIETLAQPYDEVFISVHKADRSLPEYLVSMLQVTKNGKTQNYKKAIISNNEKNIENLLTSDYNFIEHAVLK